MITPTNGRIVLFHPDATFPGEHRFDRPLAAIVVDVLNDRMVNLTVFDRNGEGFGQRNVQLLQDDDKPHSPRYAEWMPYQKGQAAKTEQLEQKLAGSTA